jgi:ASC-1-like (ASCH) protein
MSRHDIEFREVDRKRFEEIRDGVKRIETRAAAEKYLSVKEGDELVFRCGDDSFVKRVGRVYRWPSIEAMAEEVPLADVIPSAASMEETRARYASYPGYGEKIRKDGLLGFRLA